MKVKFWGVRGSIPSPGPETVKYGGNTACLEITTNSGRRIIIDAGSGIRALGNHLMATEQKNFPLKMDIFLTHTHWDHIHGYPFFVPAYIPGNEFTIHGPVNYSGKLSKIFSAQMDYTYYPIRLEEAGANVKFNELKEGVFYLDEIKITATYLNHPISCLGYRIEADGKIFCTVYDHEQYHNLFTQEGEKDSPEAAEAQEIVDIMNNKIIEHIKDADFLVYDGQYHTQEEYEDKKGWGHSTTDDAINAAIKANVKNLAIFHHDPQRKDSELDALNIKMQKQITPTLKRIFAAKERLTIKL